MPRRFKSSLEIIAGHSSRHKQILLRSDQIKLTPSEYKQLKQLIENLAAHPNPDKPELKIDD